MMRIPHNKRSHTILQCLSSFRWTRHHLNRTISQVMDELSLNFSSIPEGCISPPQPNTDQFAHSRPPLRCHGMAATQVRRLVIPPWTCIVENVQFMGRPSLAWPTRRRTRYQPLEQRAIERDAEDRVGVLDKSA